jgi:hypothetical protein
MQFEYRVSLNDLEEFRKLQARSIDAKIWFLLAGFLTIVYSSIFLTGGGLSIVHFLLQIVLPNLAIIAIAVVATNLLQKYLLKRQWRQLKILNCETAVEVDEEEIATTTDISKTTVKWAAYTHWKETENLFLLYQSNNCANIFPKRAFGDSIQMDELRELLNSKLPKQ